MTADLAAFLAARYDEAEALARTADPGPWHVRNLGRHDLSAVIRKTGETPVSHLPEGPLIAQFEGPRAARNGLHVAASDPARRLADIRLKRAILAEHPHAKAEWPNSKHGFGCSTCDWDRDFGQGGDGWCATVRQLGTEFAECDGYRDEWRPET